MNICRNDSTEIQSCPASEQIGCKAIYTVESNKLVPELHEVQRLLYRINTYTNYRSKI